MRIRDVSKDTVFVKKVGDAYLVDETEIDGIKTIRTTKNPLKAKHFTAENVYPLVYNSLDEDDARRIAKSHSTKKDSYGLLSRHVNEEYEVISTESIAYGYGDDDIIAEKKFLTSIGMEHVCEELKVVVQSIDEVNTDGDTKE